MCSRAIQAPVANRTFFAVLCFDPGLISASPHSKSKLHLNHRESNRKATVITSTDVQVFLEVM